MSDIEKEYEAAHSPYGASSAYRWTMCPGSIRAQQTAKERVSADALEGTALHAVAADCLRSQCDAEAWIGKPFRYMHKGSPRDITIIPEQAECVQMYLDVIRRDMRSNRGAILYVERTLHLSQLHKMFYGTCDALIADKRGHPIGVYDLKTGRSNLIEVRNEHEGNSINKQLGYYAIGAFLDAGVTDYSSHGCYVCIVQPRMHHPIGRARATYVSGSELSVLAKTLVEAASLADLPSPPFQAGTWCRWCRVSGSCPTLAAWIDGRLDVVYSDDGAASLPVVQSPSYDVNRIARVLDTAFLIDDWIKEVKQFATDLIAQGTNIPGYQLTERRTHRKWKNEQEAFSVLENKFGLDPQDISTLKSPNQIDRLLRAAERKAISKLWYTDVAGKKLSRTTRLLNQEATSTIEGALSDENESND